MPGIPQGRDIGEPGSQSATLLSLENGVITTETFPTASVEFHVLPIDVSGLQDNLALRNLARRSLTHLAESLESNDAVVRVRLHGQSALRWEWLRDREQWTETFRQLCEDNGHLWLEKLSFNIDDIAATANDGSAQGELAALMADIRTEPGFTQEATAYVEEIIANLPASERKKLLPSEESLQDLTSSLCKDGEEHLLAVMKGADA